MSRGIMTRRRELRAFADEPEDSSSPSIADEFERQADRLDAENVRLRDALIETEGWYRLLQADHASLQARHGQVGRKLVELQDAMGRLESRNQELEVLVDRPVGPGRRNETSTKGHTMPRIQDGLKSLARHKWASAALIAFVTLLARDPGVQGLFSSVVSKVRDAGRGDDGARDRTSSGFVLYAAMIQAGQEAEKARADYNDREASLKGDALLEAQDRLRSAKARYRRAGLAFLPELARECERAKLPVPREASEALAMLQQEAKE
jgi:hypothetical protein